MAKDEPHPQADSLCGLSRTSKVLLIISCTYSILDPAISVKLPRSITTRAGVVGDVVAIRDYQT